MAEKERGAAAGQGAAANGETSAFLLIGVPGDVEAEIRRRAELHMRSRMREAIAILTVVCRSGVKLPSVEEVAEKTVSAEEVKDV